MGQGASVLVSYKQNTFLKKKRSLYRWTQISQQRNEVETIQSVSNIDKMH